MEASGSVSGVPTGQLVNSEVTSCSRSHIRTLGKAVTLWWTQTNQFCSSLCVFSESHVRFVFSVSNIPEQPSPWQLRRLKWMHWKRSAMASASRSRWAPPAGGTCVCRRRLWKYVRGIMRQETSCVFSPYPGGFIIHNDENNSNNCIYVAPFNNSC